jgi:hypothetical protein
MFKLGSGREKKKSAVRVVKAKLNDGTVLISEARMKQFQETMKKDDLADCFLMALCQINNDK